MDVFKGIIFDMDGLLLDSERLALSAFQSTCVHFALGDLSHIFLKCVGTNLQLANVILEESFQGIMDHREFMLELEKQYYQLTNDKPVPLKDGVKYLLNHIQTLNIPMIIATSTKTEQAKSKLKGSGILNHFERVIGGDQVVNSKPDPEIYLKAASALSLNPLDCLALEDSPNGVKSALAAGMTVVQIPDLIKPTNDFLQMGHIILNSLTEVPKYNFKKEGVSIF